MQATVPVNAVRRPATPRGRIRAFAQRWGLRAAVGLLVALPGPACTSAESSPSPRGKGGERGGRKRDEAPLQVGVLELSPATIERHYRTSGTLRAIRSADIAATQLGVIEKVYVEEGDKVRQGQVLARLDSREQTLASAAASLEASNLARELERLEQLSGKIIAAEEIDKQRYAVQQAQLSAQLSKQQAKRMVITAPFAATVVERLVDAGTLATNATPMFRVADLSVLELELFVPERDALGVERGAEVELELVDGTTFTAEIARKAPIVDPLTGTVKFTIAARDYPEVAMPGAFARAKILLERKENAPSIPKAALFEIEGRPHVYVVTEGRARRRAIEVGLRGETHVEVIGGLESEEEVIAEGRNGITDDMPVEPVAIEPEPAKATATATPKAG